MYRVKKEHLGKTILKGGDKVVLDGNLSQKQLESLNKVIPAYIEEYDENMEKAQKEVDDFVSAKPKKRRKYDNN
jgi:hypothetical protein